MTFYEGIKACAAFHNETVRDVTARHIQCDEIWSFCYAKQKNAGMARGTIDGAGDVWTWTGIDADTKLIVSWLVGGRDSEYALEFMDDLRSRLANRVQLSTDGHRAYLDAVDGAFGGAVDYAQLIKVYGQPKRRGEAPVLSRPLHIDSQGSGVRYAGHGRGEHVLC